MVGRHQLGRGAGGVGAALQQAHGHEHTFGLATSAALGLLVILGLGTGQAAAFHTGTQDVQQRHAAFQVLGGVVADRGGGADFQAGQVLVALNAGGQGAFLGLGGVELRGFIGGQVAANGDSVIDQGFHGGDLGGALLAELVQVHK
ncbi:hypothetical protein FQZ97_1055430 [compost metagenome]